MLDDAELTRKIYQEQHFRRTRDEEAFSRIERQYAGSSFGIPEEFFCGARVVDVGCGNVGVLIMRLLELGAWSSGSGRSRLGRRLDVVAQEVYF